MDFQRLLTFFFPFLLARVCGRRNHIPSNTTRDWSVALCSRPPYTCSPQQITFPSDWISHIRRLSFYSNIHVALRSKKYDNDGGVCVCVWDGEYGNKKWKPSAQFVVFCNWQIRHTIFIFFTCGLHENGIEKKKRKLRGRLQVSGTTISTEAVSANIKIHTHAARHFYSVPFSPLPNRQSYERCPPPHQREE